MPQFQAVADKLLGLSKAIMEAQPPSGLADDTDNSSTKKGS